MSQFRHLFWILPPIQQQRIFNFGAKNQHCELWILWIFAPEIGQCIVDLNFRAKKQHSLRPPKSKFCIFGIENEFIFHQLHMKKSSLKGTNLWQQVTGSIAWSNLSIYGFIVCKKHSEAKHRTSFAHLHPTGKIIHAWGMNWLRCIKRVA